MFVSVENDRAIIRKIAEQRVTPPLGSEIESPAAACAGTTPAAGDHERTRRGGHS